MSSPERTASAVVGLLIGVGLLFALSYRPEPEGGDRSEVDPALATPSTVAAPSAPSDPDAPLGPGEVRPGPEPGTLIVKPFGPDPPKQISANYRVPTHREDARVTKRDDGAVVFETAIGLARKLHQAETPPEEDLQILAAILGYYRLVYKTNPVAGENSEVMRALTGDNVHRIVVFPADHPDLNGDGELLDRWGSAYFFHALSGTQLDIWSAGPDRKRNSPDDLKLGLEQPSDG